jgi:predicted DNA binding CopG/RHH family protein
MEKPMKTPKIPHTDSIAELSRFWETHDLTDFEDGLEEVPESVFERHAEETVTIHLPTAEVEAVKRLAKAKGIGHTSLIRAWMRYKGGLRQHVNKWEVFEDLALYGILQSEYSPHHPREDHL